MFKAKTVDSVLKVFTAAIEDLEKLAVDFSQLAVDKKIEANTAFEAAKDAEYQVGRAKAVALKLRDILS